MWLLVAGLLSALSLASPANCPSGWTSWGTDCYRLFTRKVFYHDAMVSCANAVSATSTLVSIHSADEQAFLQTFASGHEYAWIGFNDLAQEGQFRWTDASVVNYTNWAPHQPDNLNDSDCVFLLPNGQWDDGECEHKPFHTTPAKVFVCKTAAT
ncbi:CD209 antigen-like protein E [Pollicipes pollicipes]|uniref:CD209 antigen-like protein E n=1 Tax=Pollicipes pollicipes TaxID=41117 RepID=UPI001884A671|nr:CD209 antigen-like protein E [Pollicipes pollicipes]